MLKVSDIITILFIISNDVEKLDMFDVCPLLAGVLQYGAAPPAPVVGDVGVGEGGAVRAPLAVILLGLRQAEVKLINFHCKRVDKVVEVLKSWFMWLPRFVWRIITRMIIISFIILVK